ncbi:MAG: 2-amino-4-hydroxy-6-hydroxymethyldihydropteridine diphosphokinase [Acidobacteria bacterium]|nr:2-amino-4-hydroxy-6-hydroxymethyldihydropteridine diphosphokinase [Acidobacteriota bacterium]
MTGRTQVAVALGSNLGDRRGRILAAAEALTRLLGELRLSSLYETAPVDVVGTQGNFLNAAAIGVSSLTPEALLAALLAIEADAGRQRPHPGAPRTIDLDLVLHGQTVTTGPGVQVPHPRFRERRFVLDPLAEIAPDWVDPVTGLTIAALRQRLG